MFEPHFAPPLRDHTGQPIPGAAMTFLHPCCICGDWGSFGTAASLSQALNRADLPKATRRIPTKGTMTHRMLINGLLTRQLSTDNAGAFSEKDNEVQRSIDEHRRPHFQASRTTSLLPFGQPNHGGISSLSQNLKIRSYGSFFPFVGISSPDAIIVPDIDQVPDEISR